MTDATLEFICRNADISAGTSIGNVGIILDVVENKETHEFRYLGNGELTSHGWNLLLNGKPLPNECYGYQDIIILLDDNIPVGIVYPMGACDLHVLVLEEYRGKGIMSNFMSSGIIHQLNPGLSSVSTNHYPEYEPEIYSKINHLVAKAGLDLRVTP